MSNTRVTPEDQRSTREHKRSMRSIRGAPVGHHKEHKRNIRGASVEHEEH